jgi:hypothetical protein
LRARPEQTQLEELSDDSFLGKLLVLPANVRLDWKVIARYKHSSLFGLVACNEEFFYNTDTRRSSRACPTVFPSKVVLSMTSRTGRMKPEVEGYDVINGNGY